MSGAVVTGAGPYQTPSSALPEVISRRLRAAGYTRDHPDIARIRDHNSTVIQMRGNDSK